MASQSIFLALIEKDISIHFMKRLAHIDSDGCPSPSILNDPRHDIPDESEIQRAQQAIRYFEGGERPSFMDNS